VSGRTTRRENAMTVGGMDKKPLRATLFKTAQQIAVELTGAQLILSRVAGHPPDELATRMALEFDSPPHSELHGCTQFC